MLVSSSASKRSISSDSKRLFNARYLTPSNQKKVQKIPKKPVDTPEQTQPETSQEQEIVQNESLTQEKEFTIESLANACNDEMNQQSQEELTLSGMVKNLNENFKKSKKEVKKRLSNSKPKIRRASADKASEQSKKSDEEDYEENEVEDEEENDEEEELKKRKKAKRSIDVSEESSSTTSVTRVSKRKSSTSRPNDDESESERKSNDTSTKPTPSHDSYVYLFF